MWAPAVASAALAVALLVAVFGLLPARDVARQRPARAAPALLALLAAASFGCGLVAGQRPAVPDALVPAGMARFEGRVEQTRPGPGQRQRSVLRVLHGARLEDGAPIAPGTLLSAAPVALPEGARVRVLAKLAPRLPFRNPTPHPPPPQRFALRGSAWIASPAAVRVLALSPPRAALEAVRARVRAALDASLPARVAGIARALVLGDAGAVDPEDHDAIRDAGLLHVLAVSGLHVALAAALLLALLQTAWLRCEALALRFEARRAACALGVPLVLAYAAFAGGAPSAWRAAVTAALGFALVALGHRPDPTALAALAALLLGACAPAEAASPAFLLSIAATAAILGGRLQPASDLRAWLRAALALSARTTLATAPIVLWCFGRVPWLGLLANVLLVPLAALVLVPLSFAHALLCTLTPFAAASAAPLVLVADGFVAACEVFARLAPPLDWPPPDVWQGLLLALAAASLLVLRSARARLALAALALLGLGALELRLRRAEQPVGSLRATFLDVGQGDAALVDLPDGRAMLIDAGGNPGGGPDPGSRVLLPLLRARRRARLDLVVLTHPHPDHYGGLAALLGQVEIGELWDNGQAEGEAELQASSGEAARLLQHARALGVRVRRPAELCGRAIAAGAARIRVLAPCPRYDPGYDPNDNSIVLRIDYGRRSLLFTGDAEAHAESVLLAEHAKLHADVLKVGHHGSRTSSSAAFLRAVSPRLAIISDGAGNRFGHPHAEVLARLRVVPHVLRLDQVGGTIVNTDGRGLQVRAWSGARLRL